MTLKLSFLSTILFLIFYISSTIAQSPVIENGTITYTVESKTKFDALIDKLVDNEEFKDSITTPGMESAMNVLKSSIKPVSFELKIQNHKSQFQIIEEMDPEINSMVNMNRLLAKLVGTIFINDSDRYVLQILEIGGQEYFIDYTTEYFEWEIGEEHKNIMGYDCVKATCNRLNPKKENSQIVAWFTSEITNSIGPAGYGGLPGLIMELTTNGLTTYVVSDIYTPRPSTYVIEIPEPSLTYDIQELPALRKKLNAEQKQFWGY